LWDGDVAGSNIQYVPKIPLDSESGTDRTGNTIQVTVNFSASASGDLDLAVLAGGEHTHDVTFPDHTHPVDPGIIETTDTPSGVDVLVDGNTVATDIGSGEFQTQVDLTGELTRDAWNLIELTSDSLGHIQATLSVRGYEQIGAE
jgi:hypothetical protein